jgi:proline iminopeptidase
MAETGTSGTGAAGFGAAGFGAAGFGAAGTGAPAPALVTEGLAVYREGGGEPVLLMPQPGGLSLGPPVTHPLSGALTDLGLGVVTFDPPGSYRSRRPPRLGMRELVGCAEETLAALGLDQPVDVVGHGTGALGALSFALAAPYRVRRLVLVVPYSWPLLSPSFWRFFWASHLLSSGRGNLAHHKRLMRMLITAEYRDPALAPRPPQVRRGDRQRPAPLRDRWPASIGTLDLRTRLPGLFLPVLVCVGRYDPVTPVGAARELTSLLPDASLVVFERSGHHPFEEEPVAFRAALGAFLRPDGRYLHPSGPDRLVAHG